MACYKYISESVFLIGLWVRTGLLWMDVGTLIEIDFSDLALWIRYPSYPIKIGSYLAYSPTSQCVVGNTVQLIHRYLMGIRMIKINTSLASVNFYLSSNLT